MSSVIATSEKFSCADPRVGVMERLAQLLYTLTIFLALGTLWAMAETKSLETRRNKFLAPVDAAEIRAAADAAHMTASAAE